MTMAGKHRLFPNIFGTVYRPKVRRKPAGLSGYLPMHVKAEGYSSTFPRMPRKGGR